MSVCRKESDPQVQELSWGLECASRIFKEKKAIASRQLELLMAGERKIAFLENRLAESEAALRKVLRTTFRVDPLSPGARLPAIDSKISVILPVKNGGEALRRLLEKIGSQRKVRDVETIVIDSGSTDGTVAAAESFGCRVIRIPEKEFNHGETRNLGVREARGEFIVFTVHDAMPVTDYWLFGMVSPFLGHPELAALSSKQFVRPEADLHSQWMNEATYRSLGFEEDSLYGVLPLFDFGNWKHFDSRTKRRMSFFDNVCSCVRRSTFDEIRFNPLANAEDMDFGARLLEKRKTIGFLTSTGVFHWHERGSDYVLKRHYLGTKANYFVMKNDLAYFFTQREIDWRLLAAHAIRLHDLVTVAVPEAGSSGPDLLHAATAFLTSLRRRLNASPRDIAAALSVKRGSPGDGFKNLLMDIFGGAAPAPDEHVDDRKNFFIPRFMEELARFMEFLHARRFPLDGREADFISCIRKILAATIGDALGTYFLEAETLDTLTDELKRMDGILAKGVCYF